jgi:uncharacterized protein with von Willebrand factor type A (vWA) domain
MNSPNIKLENVKVRVRVKVKVKNLQSPRESKREIVMAKDVSTSMLRGV